jgi:LmbE family N-acetylglucosaminyl deacetylase
MVSGSNNACGAGVFDRETQKVQVIPDIERREGFQEWMEDGRAPLLKRREKWGTPGMVQAKHSELEQKRHAIRIRQTQIAGAQEPGAVFDGFCETLN